MTVGQAVRLGLMVIDHHNLHPNLAKLSDLGHRNRAAVDSDDEIRLAVFFEAARNGRLAEAIAFGCTLGYEMVGFGAVCEQDTTHQGDRAHPVDVIVSVNANLLAGIERLENALHGGPHPGYKRGIAEIAQSRHEEGFQFIRLRETALQHQMLENGRKTRLCGPSLSGLKGLTPGNPLLGGSVLQGGEARAAAEDHQGFPSPGGLVILWRSQGCVSPQQATRATIGLLNTVCSRAGEVFWLGGWCCQCVVVRHIDTIKACHPVPFYPICGSFGKH